jgi:hypothetical protein
VSVTYCGELTISQATPGAATGVAAGVTGINAALPDIAARLAALQAFAPAPVSFTAQLALAQATLTGIQAGIAAGLTPPDISAQIAAVAALIAELLAAVTSINAQLTVLTDLQSLMAAAGVHVYAFAGQVNAAGGEIATELSGGLPGGGPTDAASALLLITTTGATWTAMQSFFKTSP